MKKGDFVRLTITPDQLQTSLDLQQLGMFFMLTGGANEWTGTGTIYYLDRKGELLITEDALNLCIATSVTIDRMSLYSPVVQEAKLSENVPSDWQGAMKSDPDNEENTLPKTFQEYARVHPVDGGYLIEYVGPKDENNNVADYPLNDQLRNWITEFDGFTLKGVAKQMIADYQTANNPE